MDTLKHLDLRIKFSMENNILFNENILLYCSWLEKRLVSISDEIELIEHEDLRYQKCKKITFLRS